jgi:hypothetical protein
MNGLSHNFPAFAAHWQFMVAAALLVTATAAAQPGFLSGPAIDQTYSTHSSVVIRFLPSEALSEVYMECGLPGQTAIIRHRMTGAETMAGSNPAVGRWMRITGLAPETAYECRVGGKSRATGLVAWSDPIPYTTPSRPPDAFDPIPDPPLPPVEYPAISGSTLEATCDDLQAKIDAASALDQNLTHEVVIPAGSVCVGNFRVRNHKTGPGWIVIRSSAVGTTSFPPEGVRIDPSLYASQMVRLRTPVKRGHGTYSPAEASFSITDSSKYVRLAGIVFEAHPSIDNWVSRVSTCAAGNGSDVTVTVGGGVNHSLATGRSVRVISSNTLGALAGNTYSITSTGTVTFTLDGTSGVTGASGPCVVAVLGDTALQNCAAGEGGVIQCDTALPHGLVSGTVVKVHSPGTFGFSGRTNRVTVVDADTVTFDDTTANGTYEGGARLVMDASTYPYLVDINRGSTTTHIVLDRVWAHHWGFPYRGPFGIRMECDYCAIVDSRIDPNGQWSFTRPGTITDQRAFGASINNGYSINIQNANETLLFRNNYIGYHLLGLFADGNVIPGQPQTNTTVVRNTFEIPNSFRKDLNNPDWDGLSYEANRQGLEWKAGVNLLIRGNRFYNNWRAQDNGGAILLSPRTSNQPVNRVERVLIEYNTIASGHGGVGVGGGDTSDQPRTTPVTRRVMIRNNVFQFDGTRNLYAGGVAPGWCIRAERGVEDFVFEKNLCLNRGSQQSLIFTGGGGNSGFKVRNNILVYHHGPQPPIWRYNNNGEYTSPDGSLTYPAPFDGFGNWQMSMTALGTRYKDVLHLDPASEFTNNVLVTGVKGSNSTCDDNPSSACNATKSDCVSTLGKLMEDNLCWDAGMSLGLPYDTFFKRIGQIRLLPNFGLSSESPFKANTNAAVGLCAVDSSLCKRATDGTDLGPDIEALEAAQGVVHDVAVATTPTTATVTYTAPDAAACYVDYWTGLDSPQRISDGGGARQRSVTVEGLAQATEYKYIVQCPVEQPKGTFTTVAVVMIQLHGQFEN